MKYDADAFATALKVGRTRHKWTQDDLAEASGVTTAAIVNYERCKNIPSLSAATALADALGCTIDELVGEEVMDGSLHEHSGGRDVLSNASDGS